MATGPKSDSPEYYWLELVSELQAVLDPDDPRQAEVMNLCCEEDMELLTVADFCLVEPGNPQSALDFANLEDGTYLDIYRQSARQAAFYRLCQDV